MKEWTGTFRSLMEFWCGHVGRGFTDKDENVDEVLQACATYLDLGPVGSKMYDLTVLMLSDTLKAKDTFVDKLQDFVLEVPAEVFVITARHVLFNKRFTNNMSNSVLMSLVSLIFTGYNRGHFMGMLRDSPIFIDHLSVLEYELALIVKLHEMGLKSNLSPSIQLSPKKLAKFKTYLYRKDNLGVLAQLKLVTKSKLIKLFNNCVTSLHYAYSTNMFLEHSDNCFLQNQIFSYVQWERENTSLGESSIFLVYRALISEKFCGDDFLKHRNIYVRDKGVSIKFKTPQDEITRITLREYHSFEPYEEHYLLISYLCDKGEERFIPLDMTSVETSFKTLMYEKDASALLMVYKWLGVLDKLDLSREHFLEVYSDSEDKTAVMEIRKAFIESLKFYDEAMHEDNFVYEEPYQWNFGKGSAKGNKSREKSYVMEKRNIGRYTRKLPEGQQVSEEAKALANKLFIELEEGKTLVDEFERTQRVLVNKSSAF